MVKVAFPPPPFTFRSTSRESVSRCEGGGVGEILPRLGQGYFKLPSSSYCFGFQKSTFLNLSEKSYERLVAGHFF